MCGVTLFHQFEVEESENMIILGLFS